MQSMAQSFSFTFQTSNNQAEYESCLAGLLLARDFNTKVIELNIDSLLVVSQIKEEFSAKVIVLQKYLAPVRELLQLFARAEVKYVPRKENTRVNVLSTDIHLSPPTELTTLSTSWWGIDLLGPFPLAPGGLKYRILAVNYFTKCIEPESLATITARACIRFLKKSHRS